LSEELLQTVPATLGKYRYFNLGETNLDQLARAKLVSRSEIRDLARKKPDGIVVLSDGDVRAIVEYKQPSQLRTPQQLKRAIEQEVQVARSVCKLLIVTDGSKTFWINALTGEPVVHESGARVDLVFDAIKVIKGHDDVYTRELADIIEQADVSLSDSSNRITKPVLLDPSPLARSVWQKIWVNTGKEPEKCLYNVVELFVFKFLSDVGVLRTNDGFDEVYGVSVRYGNEAALEHYASISRKAILRLFPAGEDGTTIINGTIFVNEKGEPNKAQSHLFGEVLKELKEYSDRHGSFRFIKHEFKTRLYESFLRQQAGIKSLGQYFTPRTVVRSMIEMSHVKQLTPGSRVCDPFCGVGGFLLELIISDARLMSQYSPRNGSISPSVEIVGFDKGSDEKEDERTIILAKANMLIYLSDLLAVSNTAPLLREFSENVFNRVFKLIRTNLGSFGLTELTPFDLILTNPPYVTSGSQSLKRAIAAEGLSNYFAAAGRGTEGLAIEWIIKNLAEGGEAYVVVPDGLLNQKGAIRSISDRCHVNAIVALPSRTFFSTPKKTFILALQRFQADELPRSTFSYLVSEIGESRDNYRWDIPQNDLLEMAVEYRRFRAHPETYVSPSDRCKVLPRRTIEEADNWLVDRLWSREEKERLGIVDEESVVSVDEFWGLVEEAAATLQEALSDED
jgi:type I restriction-modification system DNA methylase subunit